MPFWGKDARSFLEDAGAGLDNVRIVCDVDMGGCSPDALVELGAPNNGRLRHRPGLHAKVYLSDRGVIVGSANASDNGIGFGPAGAKLIEAATYHAPRTSLWQAAADWFEDLYEGALQVDETAIETARARFVGRGTYVPPRPGRPGSLLDMIRLTPERFDSVGFVVASAQSSKRERTAARREAQRAGVATKQTLDAIPEEGMFVGWSPPDVLRWPATFLELWMPRDSLRIYPRTVRVLDPKAGNVFSVRDARAVRQMFPADAPPFASAQRHDAELVRRLRDEGGGLYPTARHLAEALSRL